MNIPLSIRTFTGLLSCSLAGVFSSCEYLDQVVPKQQKDHLTVVSEADTLTGAIELREIQLVRDGTKQVIPASTLNRVVVTEYAPIPSLSPVVLAVPETLTAVPGPVSVTGYQPQAVPPPSGARLDVLTDNALNSFITSISDGDGTNEALPGLVFGFAEGSLTNGPGPDLLIVDVSAAVGDTSNVCPGVPSRGGDRFFLSGQGNDSDKFAIFRPEDYVDVGPAGTFISFGSAPLSSPEDKLTSITELDQLALEPIAVLNNTRLFAIAVDLSDLGFTEGEAIEELLMSSYPVDVESGGEIISCFDIDPALIVGLPTRSE